MDLNYLFDALPRQMLSSTSDPRAFRISVRPLLFGAHPRKDKRIELAQRIRRELPFIMLWRESASGGDVTSVGCKLDTRNGDAEFWEVPESVDLDALFNELHEGGWGLFFFSQKPDRLEPPIPLVPEGEIDVSSLFGSTGAGTVIISEPDNIEWTIALNLKPSP